MLQYAIYRYSLLVILYCIAVVNIAIYQYINIIYCFTPIIIVFSNISIFYTVWLVIFMGLMFHGLGSSDDFVDLYFHGVPTLIT